MVNPFGQEPGTVETVAGDGNHESAKGLLDSFNSESGQGFPFRRLEFLLRFCKGSISTTR